jgi:hypothetical protein
MSTTKAMKEQIKIETMPQRSHPARIITTDEIALRAYALYEKRQREDGGDLQDWFQAERELIEESRLSMPESTVEPDV